MYNDKMPAIGVTERGDAGLDLSWSERLDHVDGAILITKNLNDKFRAKVLETQERKPLIVHATITGWGGTVLEPNVPAYEYSLDMLAKLVRDGFDKNRCVLRIDPIVPTQPGLELVDRVLKSASERPELDGMRVRISLLDEYAHVKERLNAKGYASFYGGRRFQPDDREVADTLALLNRWHDETGLVFETCAEPKLDGPAVRRCGCVGEKDLALMGLTIPDGAGVNPQNRHGCLCLSCKRELLDCRHRCPHKCLYCYWKD